MFLLIFIVLRVFSLPPHHSDVVWDVRVLPVLPVFPISSSLLFVFGRVLPMSFNLFSVLISFRNSSDLICSAFLLSYFHGTRHILARGPQVVHIGSRGSISHLSFAFWRIMAVVFRLTKAWNSAKDCAFITADAPRSVPQTMVFRRNGGRLREVGPGSGNRVWLRCFASLASRKNFGSSPEELACLILISNCTAPTTFSCSLFSWYPRLFSAKSLFSPETLSLLMFRSTSFDPWFHAFIRVRSRR